MYKTIPIKDATKRMLDKTKVHPRETYDELIKRLIKNARNKISS